MYIIKRAQIIDAPELHRAHMESINLICKNDYTEEQIKAWGGRIFNQEAAEKKIENDLVWGLFLENRVEGYLHCQIISDLECPYLYVMAFYFTPKLKGMGAGDASMKMIIEVAKEKSLEKILLSSTKTSVGFYLKYGFKKLSEIEETKINGKNIPSVPMELIL